MPGNTAVPGSPQQGSTHGMSPAYGSSPKEGAIEVEMSHVLLMKQTSARPSPDTFSSVFSTTGYALSIPKSGDGGGQVYKTPEPRALSTGRLRSAEKARQRHIG